MRVAQKWLGPLPRALAFRWHLQLQTPQIPAWSPIARPKCPRGGSRKCPGSASQEGFAETFQVAAARSHPRCLKLGIPGRLTLQERNLLPACLERNEGGTF